jgi:hypothetical protein
VEGGGHSGAGRMRLEGLIKTVSNKHTAGVMHAWTDGGSSSSSRFQAVLLQQCSASLSGLEGIGWMRRCKDVGARSACRAIGAYGRHIPKEYIFAQNPQHAPFVDDHGILRE